MEALTGTAQAHTVEVPSGMCWARRASQMVAFIYELLM